MPDQHSLRLLRNASLQFAGSHRPPSSRHKIVPFRRPSITDSTASIRLGEISLLATGIRSRCQLCTDKLISTNACVAVRPAAVRKPGVKMHVLDITITFSGLMIGTGSFGLCQFCCLPVGDRPASAGIISSHPFPKSSDAQLVWLLSGASSRSNRSCIAIRPP